MTQDSVVGHRAAGGLIPDGAHDRWMRVTMHNGVETIIEIHALTTVNVPGNWTGAQGAVDRVGQPKSSRARTPLGDACPLPVLSALRASCSGTAIDLYGA